VRTSLFHAVIIQLSGLLAASAGERFWKQDSAYAGSLACAKCHRAEYNLQERSHHARSLRPPTQVDELAKSLPFKFRDGASRAELALSQSASGGLELRATRQREMQRMDLEWAFGSGVKAITPLGRRADGAIIESRLTWYAGTHDFGLTTGASTRDTQTTLESLGRVLSPDEVRECFSCHTTDYTPNKPEPARQDMGIRCERCHGPGLEHTRRMRSPGGPPRDLLIFQPGKMEAFSQVQMCGACHGKPPRDTDLQAIRFIEQNPNTARFPSQRLVLSRCFNESVEQLKCTRCHDPHRDASALEGHRDQVCLDCHGKAAASTAAACPKAVSDCVSCHMPKAKVMVHSEFTDHWIRVIRTGG
jgi:predicted CXXCH cytochrome family protein